MQGSEPTPGLSAPGKSLVGRGGSVNRLCFGLGQRGPVFLRLPDADAAALRRASGALRVNSPRAEPPRGRSMR